jgi:hypothetical protein
MSFVQVMSHSGGMGSDRTPFYGIKMPLEVKNMVKLSKTVDRGILKEVLKGMWLGLSQFFLSHASPSLDW